MSKVGLYEVEVMHLVFLISEVFAAARLEPWGRRYRRSSINFVEPKSNDSELSRVPFDRALELDELPILCIVS